MRNKGTDLDKCHMGLRKSRFCVANSIHPAGTYKLGEKGGCQYRSVRRRKTSTDDHRNILTTEYNFVALIEIMPIVSSIC